MSRAKRLSKDRSGGTDPGRPTNETRAVDRANEISSGMVFTLRQFWFFAFIFISAIFSIIAFTKELSAQQITSGMDRYRTLHTEHFRIHYPVSNREAAYRVARMTERVHARMYPHYNSGVEKTDVVLVYDNDTVNAFASVVGRDHVVLFASNPRRGPSGGTGWSYFDTWTEELFIHEYAHILSLRYKRQTVPLLFYLIAGVPANITAPSGMTEGIAVFEESLEGRGRNNDPITRMIFRKAVQEDAWPGPGALMNGTHHWPGGSTYYIYGGSFTEFLVRKYGPEVARGYWKTNTVPVFLSKRLRIAGAQSYTDLYDQYSKTMKESMNREINRILADGVTPETRLTDDGGYKSDLILQNGKPVYFQTRLNRIPGIYAYNRNSKSSQRIRRARASHGLAWGGGRRFFSEEYFAYPGFGLRYELYDPDRILGDRVLPGKSISYPSLSSDGRVLHFILKGRRHRYVIRARVGEGGQPGQYQVIYRVNRSGVLESTTTSRDGSTVVFLARHSNEGQPSLVRCRSQNHSESQSESQSESRSNNLRERTRSETSSWSADAGDEQPGKDVQCSRIIQSEHAILHPHTTADGSILFSSDGRGIFELYRYNPKSKNVQRLTATTGGHFFPVRHGEELYYLSYGSDGYDLAKTRNEDLVSEKADGYDTTIAPLPVLRSPYKGRILSDLLQLENENQTDGELPARDLAPGDSPVQKDESYGGIFALEAAYSGLVNAGYLPGLSYVHLGVIARDPLNRHYLSVLGGYSQYGPEGYMEYDYSRYDLSFTGSVYTNRLFGKKVKQCNFRRKSIYEEIFCGQIIPYREEADGYLRYSQIGRYLSFQLLAGYRHSWILEADRYSGIQYKYRDIILAGPSLLLGLGNTHSYPKSISQEDGWNLSLSVDHYMEENSAGKLSDSHREPLQYTVIQGGLSLYLPFFFQNHVQYFNAYGYTSYGRDRDSQEVSEALFVRGQDLQFAKTGRSAVAFTWEYRFPLLWLSEAIIKRIPEFTLRQLDMALFLDTGAAFTGELYRDAMISGYGVRLNMGSYLFYVSLPVQMGVTLARGTGAAGETRIQFHATVGFFGPISGRAAMDPARPALESQWRPGHPLMRQTQGYHRNQSAGSILY